ncbi:MAG: hypothetical protein JWM33_481 [Caulobacteraceae bacterium]|nr:hypothetical protein [Caulobacteraceae bacterium]
MAVDVTPYLMMMAVPHTLVAIYCLARTATDLKGKRWAWSAAGAGAGLFAGWWAATFWGPLLATL